MGEFFRSVAASLMVAIPILSVPAIAVFGVPQFESLSTPPQSSPETCLKTETRAGESLSYISQDIFVPATVSDKLVAVRDLLSPQSTTNTRPLTRPVKQVEVKPKKLTWRGAIRQLNELGIQDYRLMPGNRDETFLFVCSLSLKHRPRVTHRFAAEAVEPLRAVQNVIGQIEERMAQQAR